MRLRLFLDGHPLYRALRHRNLRRIKEVDALRTWLDPRPGERILDVGCGDGYQDRAIVNSGARVVGVDVDAVRIEAARRAFRSGRATGTAEFHRMDAHDLAFERESFDKAVSFCVLEHLERDDIVLGHLHRVLRPNGLLFLSVDSLSNRELTAAERESQRRRYAVNTLYTSEELRRRLAEAGFELERYRYLLTAPLTLRLVRVSWRVDDLPWWAAPVKGIAFLALGTVGYAVANAVERASRREDSGLTLLAAARRR